MNSAPPTPNDSAEDRLNHQRQSLKQSVTEAMQRYFSDLDGQATHDLYDIVMAEVEPPLLKAVMAYTRQNQSRAAETLGLNRGTLRKKLKQYDLL
jgi:Fis family transcriptional regulator, factor for inversion stimulation protein